jgi:hypothetical protein
MGLKPKDPAIIIYGKKDGRSNGISKIDFAYTEVEEELFKCNEYKVKEAGSAC